MNYIEDLARKIESELDEASRPSDRGPELYRLYALLALVKGPNVSLSDVHDAWSVWMSETDPVHSALIPFEELDNAKKEEDRPHADAIRRAASATAASKDR